MLYYIMEDENMPNLGEFIKNKRKAAGISQKTLANISGVADSTIHNIEINKTRNPGWELLCKIAVALEFHPFEILKEAGYITENDINPTLLIKGLDKLNNQEREVVQLFIDFILSKKNAGSTRKESDNYAFQIR